MINALSLKNLQQRFGGVLVNGDAVFDSVSTDTRHIQAGDLFVALKGASFDAHDFLADAVASGAAALVVENETKELSLPQWLVDDTTVGLGHIAKAQRDNFSGKLIAITGSGGKTTVKGMLQSIFQQLVGDKIFATKGNLNNHIGVPLSLLSLTKEHSYAVIEMGASAVGDIAYLTSIGDQSDVAVVNNVMAAHIEGFGSLDNIARGKGEIYDGLSERGVAVINTDDHYAPQWLSQNQHRQVITFSIEDKGETNNNHVYSSAITFDAEGCATFALHFQDKSESVRLLVAGKHNVANALSATACALALGVDLATIASGLILFSGVDGRLKRLSGINNSVVIDDSYNANPDSVCAAIDVLATMQGNKILVLGDMGELGENSIKFHQDVGRYANSRSIDFLLTTGVYTKESSEMFSGNAAHYDAMDQAIEAAASMANKNTIFLIKGSRSSRMDKVVQALIDRGDNT